MSPPGPDFAPWKGVLAVILGLLALACTILWYILLFGSFVSMTAVGPGPHGEGMTPFGPEVFTGAGLYETLPPLLVCTLVSIGMAGWGRSKLALFALVAYALPLLLAYVPEWHDWLTNTPH